MIVGDAFLKLDKDWDMQELASLSKLYIQCYSLVYSLSGFEVDSTDERVIDWFQGAYAKYPWRGGFSTVNFYHSLYAKVPYEERPQIQEIKYASPGHIKLKEALLAAGMLAGIVTAVTSSIDQIHDTYNKIQKGLSERKLTKLEVRLSKCFNKSINGRQQSGSDLQNAVKAKRAGLLCFLQLRVSSMPACSSSEKIGPLKI